MKPKDIKQGKTIYKVYALGCSSYIQKAVIVGRPYATNNGNIFFREKVSYGDGKYYKSKSSLLDWNITPNKYNDHKAFFSRKNALKYLEECKRKLYFQTGVNRYIARDCKIFIGNRDYTGMLYNSGMA